MVPVDFTDAGNARLVVKKGVPSAAFVRRIGEDVQPGDVAVRRDGVIGAAQVALLAAAGSTLADVVSCLVHLADLADFERFNAVYEQHFAEPRPVRTTVGAALLGGALVEITATAHRSTPD